MTNAQKTAIAAMFAAFGVGVGTYWVDTETGEVTAPPVVETRTFKECFDAQDWECTLPRVAACVEDTGQGRSECRRQLLSGEIPPPSPLTAEQQATCGALWAGIRAVQYVEDLSRLPEYLVRELDETTSEEFKRLNCDA